jgi:hypothetical protein
MAAKLIRLTHTIAIQLHLVAESCTICSSRSWRPVQKLLDTPSYVFQAITFLRKNNNNDNNILMYKVKAVNNVSSYSGGPEGGSCATIQPPSCATVRCAPGMVCRLREVQCFAAPCYPLPICEPVTEGWYHPATVKW